MPTYDTTRETEPLTNVQLETALRKKVVVVVVVRFFGEGRGRVDEHRTRREDNALQESLNCHSAGAWPCETAFAATGNASRVNCIRLWTCLVASDTSESSCDSPPMSAALSLSQPTTVSCTTPVGVGFASAFKVKKGFSRRKGEATGSGRRRLIHSSTAEPATTMRPARIYILVAILRRPSRVHLEKRKDACMDAPSAGNMYAQKNKIEQYGCSTTTALSSQRMTKLQRSVVNSFFYLVRL